TSDRLRILIAEDHEGYRDELRRTLAREPDLEVVAAESNGADAVRRVRALRPHGLDLVLMDIDMPVMNGIQAAAEIEATDPDLPPRGLAVRRGIAGGAPDREIASALQVAETTVKTHVRNILRKLGARNRAEAAARLR